jgi:hypothetical protein
MNERETPSKDSGSGDCPTTLLVPQYPWTTPGRWMDSCLKTQSPLGIGERLDGKEDNCYSDGQELSYDVLLPKICIELKE